MVGVEIEWWVQIMLWQIYSVCLTQHHSCTLNRILAEMQSNKKIIEDKLIPPHPSFVTSSKNRKQRPTSRNWHTWDSARDVQKMSKPLGLTTGLRLHWSTDTCAFRQWPYLKLTHTLVKFKKVKYRQVAFRLESHFALCSTNSVKMSDTICRGEATYNKHAWVFAERNLWCFILIMMCLLLSSSMIASTTVNCCHSIDWWAS